MYDSGLIRKHMRTKLKSMSEPFVWMCDQVCVFVCLCVCVCVCVCAAKSILFDKKVYIHTRIHT